MNTREEQRIIDGLNGEPTRSMLVYIGLGVLIGIAFAVVCIAGTGSWSLW